LDCVRICLYYYGSQFLGGANCTAGMYYTGGKCLHVPAGFYNPWPMSQMYYKCPAGKYSVGGAVICLDCAVALLAGAVSCGATVVVANPCSGGYYALKNLTCTVAAAGTYVPFSGAQTSFACPQGRYSAAGQSSCASCSPGAYYSSTAKVCILCPTGYFSGSYGAAACTACPAGTFTGQTGSTGCSGCYAGTYSSTTGSTNCSICPIGTFAYRGMSVCAPCYANNVGKSDRALYCYGWCDVGNGASSLMGGVFAGLDGCPSHGRKSQTYLPRFNVIIPPLLVLVLIQLCRWLNHARLVLTTTRSWQHARMLLGVG
jgi:hypothetical protein